MIKVESKILIFYIVFLLSVSQLTLNSFKFLKLLLSTPALPSSQSPLKKPLHVKKFFLLLLKLGFESILRLS